VFYPLRVFQNHHKWFLPPTIGIRAPFVRKQKCFGRYPNFQSCQKQVLIIPQCRAHPYELTGANISLIGDGGSPHAPPEDSALFDHAPRGRRRLRHTRAIFKPRRATKPTSKRSRSIAAAEPIEYSTEYSRFNPSEPPDAQNWCFDQFTLFLTQFQQSQTGSLLF